MGQSPVLFDLEDTQSELPKVAEAAPVPEPATPVVQGAAMQRATTWAARKPSRLVRLFWGVLFALIGAVISLRTWAFVSSLMADYPVIGLAMTGLIAVFLALLAVLSLRELAAFGRLSRLDGIRRAVDAAHASPDLAHAQKVTDKVAQLYRRREDMRWARDRLADLRGDQLDAQRLLHLTEAELMAPLDQSARKEIEAAARQVATVTALVPLALADVAAALTANLRMIRRIAEIYGGRSGFLGGWRLTRAVMTHMVATGAVAVADDLLEPILGGSILSKVSRRFGEGLVNGALTARVGVAAIEVCRPMPFVSAKRPNVRNIIGRALTGVFGKGGDAPQSEAKRGL